MFIKLLPTSTVCAVEGPMHSVHFNSVFVNNTRIMTMIMILMTVIVLEKSRSWRNNIYSFIEQRKYPKFFVLRAKSTYCSVQNSVKHTRKFFCLKNHNFYIWSLIKLLRLINQPHLPYFRIAFGRTQEFFVTSYKDSPHILYKRNSIVFLIYGTFNCVISLYGQ